MTVYLDDMNHLLPDPINPNFEELHRIAQAAGMQREWFQDRSPSRYPHYDILSPEKRRKARKAGAMQIRARDWMERRKADQGMADAMRIVGETE